MRLKRIIRASLAGLILVAGTSAIVAIDSAAATTSAENSAMSWAKSQVGTNLDPNLCLKFVFSAWTAAGVNLRSYVNITVGNDTYPSDIWMKFSHGTTGTGTPPPGALVFFLAKPNRSIIYSHVMLSLGGGQNVSTADAFSDHSPTPEAVHFETLSQQASSGSYATYAGWWLPDGTKASASPIVPTTSNAANHVLRVSATGTSYLVDRSGIPHWIPDELTYLCDVALYPLWNGVTQAQVNALGNGQPWAPRCTNSAVAAGHIVVVDATNTSYLVDDAGTPHWIPSVAVFNCLAAKGYTTLRGLVQSQVDAMGNGKPWATCTASTSPAATTTPTTPPSGTYGETTGGVAHTWTNYSDAGGTQGPSIASNQTVQITCRTSGFAVADGNTWWYEIASSPWDNSYWVSADAFYNNGSTSGSLVGTPFYDPSVPVCSGGTVTATTAPSATTTTPAAGSYAETTGGVAHTWTNFMDAGGSEGPPISSNQTVQITCRTTGFTVADGNNWWYEIASGPWANNYWVSADAFYNNGSTSGSLVGTPFYDPNVPVCSGATVVTTTTPSATTTTTPQSATFAETTGGVAHTWTNYSDAGGTQGPSIASNQTVQITCRLTGFAVADGNTWWYEIASSPWNNSYWVSADAFYNNGATSGSLVGTPFYDPRVPVC